MWGFGSHWMPAPAGEPTLVKLIVKMDWIGRIMRPLGSVSDGGTVPDQRLAHLLRAERAERVIDLGQHAQVLALRARVLL